MANKPLLELKNVVAGYGELQVLHDVSVSVSAGQIVALIGPNGAGKSTVLKSVFSIAQVASGKILLSGKDITGLATHKLLDLGVSYVPQGKINFPTLTAEENLLVGAAHIRDKVVIAERIKRVHEQFPVLEEKRKVLSYSLSGGEQQMLALGRALMQNPKVLLLDEPSLGLSPKLVTDTFLRIKQLAETGLAVLIVEQNAKKAIEIADKTYLLETGQIALEGNKKIVHHPKIKQIYLGGDIDE